MAHLEFMRELRPHFVFWLLEKAMGAVVITAILVGVQYLQHHLDAVAIGVVFVTALLTLGWIDRKKNVALQAANVQQGASATARESSEQRPTLSHMDSARLSETKQQLLCLSLFECFALWQLLLKGGLTGQQFAEIVQAFGIPVATLFGQKELAKTFAIVQDKSAMLVCDETSGRWAVKPEFKDFVHYWIERMSPVFGI